MTEKKDDREVGVTELEIAINALDTMLDMLHLDDTQTRAIKQFFREYTKFVAAIGNYGVRAYNSVANYNKIQIQEALAAYKQEQELLEALTQDKKES